MISAIAAMSQSRVIGCQGQLPWRIPEDFKRFREVTTGHTVVMGRRTFESIGKALPGRNNVVLTRHPIPNNPGVEVHRSKESVLGTYSHFFVIGGEQIYGLFLPQVSTIHLTVVPGTYRGDAYFPEFETDFELKKVDLIPLICEFRIYERKTVLG